MPSLDHPPLQRTSPRPGQAPRDKGRVTGLHTSQITLLAGQWWLGQGTQQVKTLLGSCVGVTLWHPGRRLGAMCHYLLPERRRPVDEPRDARFGDEALEMIVEALGPLGVRPQDCEAHLYGGADTLSLSAGVRFNVGERNIERGWQLIDHYGFQLIGVDVGDTVPRTVSLDMRTGEVAMRRGADRQKAPA